MIESLPDARAQKVSPGLTVMVENLSKRFNREWIFRNFSFRFLSGDIYAITGPNGSGKSTMLQVLWGQVPQTSGTIVYKDATGEISADAIFAHTSIATPYMDLIDEFTLTEQLNFHFRLRKIREGFSIPKILEIMYLREARDKTIANFSSGMKQRVKLAMAFYTQADALFLDEPCTNLDQQAIAWYKHELSAIPGETLVFIASNNPIEYPAKAHVINVMEFKKQ